MKTGMSDLQAYLNEHGERFTKELFDFLRIPSVSTDPEQAGTVRQCAQWVADHLRGIGFKTVEVHDTAGHPIVYAEHCEAPGKPTVLLYGHYDVQPPEPLDEWLSPPFEPTIRDGKIFARGATDDKGQIFSHIKGLEALLKTGNGKLPVNVKVLIEGEEEVGSMNLEPWVSEHKAKLACDAVVISDSSMHAPGLPSLTTSLRGLAYFEVTVTGTGHDLHSGLYGGAVPNAINELARLIAKLHDEDYRVTVPGFYDDVLELTEAERAELNTLPHSDAELLAEVHGVGLVGEAARTTLERLWYRPTLDCNGIWGGYTAKGAKTVIAAKAHAKLSCRLVPDQDPTVIEKAVRAHLTALAPAHIKVDVSFHHGAKPWRAERDNASVQAALRAMSRAWGRDAVFIGGGGSIPVVTTFRDALGVPSVLIGLGLADDRLHSPNEKFDLINFEKGVATSAFFYEELGK
jgi:acetylornithine deacetylase/succinyl-diaminopimelate desuccinylase-like protein